MGKKKGSKKGKKKSSKKGKKTASDTAVANAGPTQLELSLRLELQILEKDLVIARREAEEARVQNEFLHDEVKRTKEENAAYEGYIHKKTTAEKKMIEELTEQNQREIDAINTERSHLVLRTDRIKKELKDAIELKESELTMTEKQIDELADIQKKREEQEAEIKELEANVERLKQEHFESLQELKSSFLVEKKGIQQSGNQRVKELQSMADQEAVDILTKHSGRIKDENRRLKNKLLTLMGNNKLLLKEESTLKQQNDELRRQIELNSELVRIVDSKKSVGGRF